MEQDQFKYTKTLVWFFLFVILSIIILLVVFWILSLCSPSHKNNLEACNVNARNLMLSNNGLIANRLSVGCKVKTKTMNIKGNLIYDVFASPDSSVVLDGKHTLISLTSPNSGSPVTVTLPPTTELDGMIVIVMNDSANSSFVVQPQSNETINGSNSAQTFSSPVFAKQFVASAYKKDWNTL